MAEFIHEHSTRLTDEDGTAYVVRIYGLHSRQGRPDLLTCPRHAQHRPARFVWVLAILIYTVALHFQPMPLLKRAQIRRLPRTRRNRAWPCSVVVAQRASVRFLLGAWKANLGFTAERNSHH